MRPKHFGLALALVALFGAGFLAGKSPATQDGAYRQLDAFVEVLDKVEKNYVDPVAPDKLVRGAIKGMLRGLDPFSQFLEKDDYRDLRSITSGQFGGLGIVISVRDNYPTVISPLEGTPAYSLGIQSGDVIVKIDGVSTRGYSSEDAVHRLRGPEGSQVTITVAREGEPERDITIQRQTIHVRSVPYAYVVEPGVGYLRLSNFAETTAEEVEGAVRRLEGEGVRGIILDLRDNPGGLLTQAVDVSELFVPQRSLIVYTKGRASGANTQVYADDARPHTELPLVVLINEGSASASEIVAGALQDLDRALLVGETSFGKGSVQSVIELARGGALKLTTARYYTPSGRSIHKESWDHIAEDEEALADDDEREPEPSPPDTAARPVFKTRAGRTVYGGGGITPDVVVRADTLQPLSREVERRGLFFKFAVRHAARHPGEGVPRSVSPALWNDFVALLRATGVSASPAALVAERPYLERGLRRELARRHAGTHGDEAAFRVASEADPQLARAVEFLRRARNSSELIRISAR